MSAVLPIAVSNITGEKFVQRLAAYQPGYELMVATEYIRSQADCSHMAAVCRAASIFRFDKGARSGNI